VIPAHGGGGVLLDAKAIFVEPPEFFCPSGQRLSAALRYQDSAWEKSRGTCHPIWYK